MAEHEYLVRWEIEVTATSPVEAARAAQRIQRDPASLATVFDVGWADGSTFGNEERIDLLAHICDDCHKPIRPWPHPTQAIDPSYCDC